MNVSKHLLFIAHAGGNLFRIRSLQGNIVIRPCLEEHNIGVVGIQQLVSIVHQVLIRAAAEAMVLHPIFRQVMLHLRPHAEIGRTVEDDAVLLSNLFLYYLQPLLFYLDLLLIHRVLNIYLSLL